MSHHVLLVDDDPLALAGVRRALHRSSFEIHTAASATEALEALRAETIDLVVSDHEMSGMSGVEFLGEVRRRHPDVVRIMLTGKGTADVAVKAINVGEVYRFLIKPVDPRDLALAIRQGLEQRDLLMEGRRLLEAVRNQGALMEAMESEVHGITHVERDSSGAIVLSDVPTDFDSLIREMQAASQDAEDRVRRMRARNQGGAFKPA